MAKQNDFLGFDLPDDTYGEITATHADGTPGLVQFVPERRTDEEAKKFKYPSDENGPQRGKESVKRQREIDNDAYLKKRREAKAKQRAWRRANPGKKKRDSKPGKKAIAVNAPGDMAPGVAFGSGKRLLPRGRYRTPKNIGAELHLKIVGVPQAEAPPDIAGLAIAGVPDPQHVDEAVSVEDAPVVADPGIEDGMDGSQCEEDPESDMEAFLAHQECLTRALRGHGRQSV